MYRENVILEKCKEFFEGYKNISSMLYFFEKGIEKLSELERKWGPSKFELNKLFEVTKRDPNAPVHIKNTIDFLDTIETNMA